MYVRAPEALGVAWARGVRLEAVVESVDLFPTLTDLAGLPNPR